MDFNDHKLLEKYSSAVTMSDMEIFIFPELMQALSLANMMSPLIWEWKKDPWFKGIEKMTPYRRVLRVKQYIMDHYSFNLDLETWGLTTKEAEIERFRDFVDMDILAQSNALFGYEGDKYYFSIDIRKHFGLDSYNSNVIPYWKTETVEAMTAFYRKDGYLSGAGECVSLAALYYAAMFIIARIPLDKMFMLGTPLHSQNFIDLDEGVITNNRRIVTKKMWFNGTEFSQKARRALENEQVTFIASHSGYVHHVFDEATIDPEQFARFKDTLAKYLETKVTYEVVVNFLRQSRERQHCFQFQISEGGKHRYIEAEKVYAYEMSSAYRIGEPSEQQLLLEIDEDELYTSPIPSRMSLTEVKEYFDRLGRPLELEEWEEYREKIRNYLGKTCDMVENTLNEFISFCRIVPNLPDENKTWRELPLLDIASCSSGEEIEEVLEKMRPVHPVADLAFTAYRDLKRSSWKPFLKAALERNPVICAGAEDVSPQELYAKLAGFSDASIYPGNFRLAQPDEVWNYQTGDGLEKAIAMATVICKRNGHKNFSLVANDEECSIVLTDYEDDERYLFRSDKCGVVMPDREDWVF